MVLPGQMASQVNVITKRENTVCTVGPPYLPLTSHHPGGLTHEFASKKKRGGGGTSYFFKSTTYQGQQKEFRISLLVKLKHLSTSAFYHSLEPPKLFQNRHPKY